MDGFCHCRMQITLSQTNRRQRPKEGTGMNKPLHTPRTVRLPEWLDQLKSELVNNVPDEAIESVIDAARGVADFDTVRHELAIRRMDRLIKSQQTNIDVGDTKTSGIVANTLQALRMVKRFYEDTINRGKAEEPTAWIAWSASHQAWSAAWQDVQLAWSTRPTAAAAKTAKEIAQSAADAAKAANWSTELSLSKSEAMSALLAAKVTGWQAEVDALIAVLRGAK